MDRLPVSKVTESAIHGWVSVNVGGGTRGMMGLRTLLLPRGVTVRKLQHDSSSRFMNHRLINHSVCVQLLTGVNRKKETYCDTAEDDK